MPPPSTALAAGQQVTNRNAIYKNLFDARRKLRRFLVTHRNYLAADTVLGRSKGGTMSSWEALESLLAHRSTRRRLRPDVEAIHTHAQIVVDGGDPELTMPRDHRRHLATCGPCAEDYLGLLAALRQETGAVDESS